jgi:hypothetical protein
MVPGLEERLMEGFDEDVVHIAELVCGIANFLFNILRLHLLDSEGGL